MKETISHSWCINCAGRFHQSTPRCTAHLHDSHPCSSAQSARPIPSFSPRSLGAHPPLSTHRYSTPYAPSSPPPQILCSLPGSASAKLYAQSFWQRGRAYVYSGAGVVAVYYLWCELEFPPFWRRLRL